MNHAARKNIKLPYVIMDNFVDGLTKKQTSPSSPIGFKSKTDPTGSIDRSINPMKQLLASGATFIARTHAAQVKHMVDTFERAILHDGFSVVECLSECVMFYEGSSNDSTPRKGGFYFQVDRPMKNASEQKWIDETQAKLGGASQKDLFKNV